MSKILDPTIRELDTVALSQDLPSQGLKQGDQGAVVHVYADGKAFEVEFINLEGDTLALLTLTRADIQPVHRDLTHPEPIG